MNDNIYITTPEALEDTDYGHEYVRTTHKAPDSGKYAPTGIAGYVVGECTVVCHECFGTEPADDDDPSPIWGDSETDYPGHYCEDCDKWLDTYLIVYKSQDAELFYRLEQTESHGLGWDETVATIPEIAAEAHREAYELGYSEAMPIDTADPEIATDDPEQAADETPELLEAPTDSARYANHIAPKLRAIAGYHDSGHGTYTDCYYETAADVLTEDVHEGYRAGYTDRRLGHKHGHSLD